MALLARFIRRNVDPEKYYKSIFPEVTWSASSDETKVLSPFTEEKIPSLSINRNTGAWYSFCADDQYGGNSIISFHASYYECTNKTAGQEIYHKFIHPVIPEKQIQSWMKKLHKTPSALAYLRNRLLSKKIVQHYNLGWDGTRITIPIRNEFGLCVNAKLCHPLSKEKKFKMLNYRGKEKDVSYGSPTTLFPLSALEEGDDSIVICEGEWDTLALLSIGISAITSTSGGKSWPRNLNHLFRHKNVVLAYDNDEPGVKGRKKVIRQLLDVAKTIKQIIIPKKYGKDVTDYMMKKTSMRDRKAWVILIGRSNLLVDNPIEEISSSEEVIQVPLDQSSQSKWFGQRIQLEALITGKDTSPYLLPEKFRVSCSLDCEECLLTKDGKGFREYHIETTNPDVLTMIDTTKQASRQALLNRAGIKKMKDCKAEIKILKTFNIECILLIPTLDSGSKEYVVRPAYYVGYGLRANKAYRFKGILLPHPKDQHTTYLFDSAEPVQDEIETFELTQLSKKKLIKLKPKKLNYLAYLMSIAEWQSRNITKILERPDLHIAVDLAYHSVQAFWFNKEFVPRGMLDILILGDTRCGKGYVTERLSKYYGLGEIASGDNCSFAGLVGGLQQIGSNWRITWGLIPLNNKRIVIIDETSSLSERDIGRMSRIRSEGVAEIVKIIRETTHADTRLIWLANPRSGQPISTYNTGVEAVKELIGAVEDISRFDFVLTLASNEVPSEVINAPATYLIKDSNKYPQELCRALILWAWSRTPNQIKFTDEATKRVINMAIEFGQTYSSIIPLVQAENIRLKIAKISATIAVKTLSVDSSFTNLFIKVKHVNCAGQILRMFYDKPSMSYNLFSKTTMAASKITGVQKISKAIDTYSDNSYSTITGLLELQRISTDNLSDYVGESQNAKLLIGELVQLRCLSRVENTNYYTKTPEFKFWLRKKQKKYTRKKNEDN